MIELVDINSVKTNPDNPRTISDEKFNKLVKSINEFPEMLKLRPIVVDADMFALGGNMRLKACTKAGLDKVYVIKADTLSEDQKKQFVIKDNVGFGEWDWDDLNTNWDSDDLIEWGLDLPDFFEEEEKEIVEPEDLSDTLKDTYEVIVECNGEPEQEELYNRLIEEGLTCRVLTL